MPSTYEPIATTTLTTSASTISFTSIPSTYTDLKLILVLLGTSSGSDFTFRFNSDTGSNYRTQIFGASSDPYASFASGDTTNQTEFLGSKGSTVGASTTIPNLYDINIFSYTSTTMYKTCYWMLSENHNSATASIGGAVGLSVGTWVKSPIAAITSIDLAMTSFDSGTTATLYGIKKA